MSVSLILFIIMAIFFGALMRATFGFGDAVVSMPLLALLPIDLTLAISLIGLSGLTVAAMSLSENFHNVDRSVFFHLGSSTLLGVPAGILLILFLPEQIVMLALGSALIIYASYSLRISPSPSSRFEDPAWALPFGFFSGMFGSAYNFNGIPVVIYATLRQLSPPQFRSTLQAHFLLSGFFVVLGQALGGFWSRDLLLLFILSLPALLLAVFTGNKLYERIPAHRFSHFVYLLTLILGIILLVEAR